MAERAYHHGDLRRALLAAAVEAITESGPAALSLRDLARRAGVSHAAPTHHFGDKAGLLTALAAEGFDLLAGALTAGPADGGDFLEVGVAYVRFAMEHRPHFEVMFRPDLYHADDPELVAARARSSAALYGGVATAAPPAGMSSGGMSSGGMSSAGMPSAGMSSADAPPPSGPLAGALPGAPPDRVNSPQPPDRVNFPQPPDRVNLPEPADWVNSPERPDPVYLPEPADGDRFRAVREAGLAAWSLVHGFTTLWLSGAFPADLGDDPDAAARVILRRLPPIL